MKLQTVVAQVALALLAASPAAAGKGTWGVAASVHPGGIQVGFQYAAPPGRVVVAAPAPVPVAVPCAPPPVMVVAPPLGVMVAGPRFHPRHPHRRVMVHAAPVVWTGAPVWIAPAPVVAMAPCAPPAPVYPVAYVHPAFCR